MPHSFSYAVSMNLEHSIKEASHERYPDHLQCFRNIKKIKYPDFQAMTLHFYKTTTETEQYIDANSDISIFIRNTKEISFFCIFYYQKSLEFF